ncbi:peptidase M56 [Paenibacillus oryzae]|uniref:Peptidase M56 n=2 Tax=Paenibacillus oryzae TaxID=1844972 RepID=A0A1A5YDW0_9BACL|nr:peptidase M56 [Paenibacillus oryzae]
MSPIMKLRGSYGLMMVIILIAIVQMGVIVTSHLHAETLQQSVFSYAIVVLAGYMLVKFLWRVIQQLHLSRKWFNHFQNHMHVKLTKQLQYKYRNWDTEIIVVQDDAFVALTIGLLRPKIVISTMVLSCFSEKEIKAILLHERYHCLKQDGRKHFFSILLADAFGYLPIVKPIIRYYETWKELFADRYAIQQMGTELYLGNVLLKLAKHKSFTPCGTAVYFANSTLQYRLMQVLEPERTVVVPLTLLKPFLRTCSMLLLILIGGDS